ncbi:methyltransferase domain-containing protein [Aeromicrobium sp. CTD01-1L150]|uniref:class I SAM-dependent methyltransferase n=1 Tax=Aeromicrobium sp. CTD01-1L150 TaxID=3341830 RepID=UPI0035C0D6C8
MKLIDRVGPLHVSRKGVRVPRNLPEDVASLDVMINGHRVWSIDLVSDETEREVKYPWPDPLLPFLDGTGHVELKDSSTGQTLTSTDVSLGRSTKPIEVLDALGRHVSINKWGRLGKTFYGADQDMRTRMLDQLDILISVLQGMDFKPFIVGGTLLGAVRTGEILPHDDDADLAYLSDLQHPADISLENARLEKALTAQGYEIVKHSNTHLQITFRTADGVVDSYIDIFTAFFTPDGQINQPFHVRGPMERSSMLPFSTVELEARLYPAPAVPEDWLVVNYDENWRTPLPGYKLRTPRSTRRRFQNWFGSYHFQRDFWEERYLYLQDEPADLRAADDLLASTSDGDVVIDMGCGVGAAAQHLAHRGRHVEAFDYSESALTRARELQVDDVQWHRTNLIDLREAADLLEVIATAERPVHLLVNHVFERLGHHGRANTWRIARQVARAGGQVVSLVDTVPDPGVEFRNPTTWHLSLSEIEAEIEPYGLRIEQQSPLADTPRDRLRRTHIIRITTSTNVGTGTP